jgi:hypothetical protein
VCVEGTETFCERREQLTDVKLRVENGASKTSGRDVNGKWKGNNKEGK